MGFNNKNGAYAMTPSKYKPGQKKIFDSVKKYKGEVIDKRRTFSRRQAEFLKSILSLTLMYSE